MAKVDIPHYPIREPRDFPSPPKIYNPWGDFVPQENPFGEDVELDYGGQEISDPSQVQSNEEEEEEGDDDETESDGNGNGNGDDDDDEQLSFLRLMAKGGVNLVLGDPPHLSFHRSSLWTCENYVFILCVVCHVNYFYL